MTKSVYYFRRYRQSQDGAIIPEERNGQGTRNGRERRNTVVLDDRIISKKRKKKEE